MPSLSMDAPKDQGFSQKPVLGYWDVNSKEKQGTSEDYLQGTKKRSLFSWKSRAKMTSNSNATCCKSKKVSSLVKEKAKGGARGNWFAIIGRCLPWMTTQEDRDSQDMAVADTQAVIPGFAALPEVMKSVLLSLILGESTFRNATYTMDNVCWWLAIVHGKTVPLMRSCVQALVHQNYVETEFHFRDLLGADIKVMVNFKKLRRYKKFAKRVMQLNPEYDTHLNVWIGAKMAIFEPSGPQQQNLKVLSLQNCENLETLDLRNLPRLRSLAIMKCQNLERIGGWECVKALGMLHIQLCPSYLEYPDIDHLPALQICCVQIDAVHSTVKLSQCHQLRSLAWVNPTVETADFTAGEMKRLEYLSLEGCTALSNICGISELQSLSALNLKSLPNLDALPDLGALESLTILEIYGSRMEEIPGVELLGNLQYLDARNSQLKRLPDLSHLSNLREVWLEGTQLEASSAYYNKTFVSFQGPFMSIDPMMELSDTEYENSDVDEVL